MFDPVQNFIWNRRNPQHRQYARISDLSFHSCFPRSLANPDGCRKIGDDVLPSQNSFQKKKSKSDPSGNFLQKGRLTLSSATGGASVAAHGNGHGLGGNVLEESESLGQLHAVDGLGGLTGVLEADTQVRAARAGALGLRDLLGGVTDLYRALLVSNGLVVGYW